MSAVTQLAVPASPADIDLLSLVFDVPTRKLKSFRLENRITDAQLERTMDGASTLTLTVHDPARTLLRSPVVRDAFDVAIDATLDTYRWRLVQLGKQDTDLTFVFEDLPVAQLRANVSTLVVSRDKMTRAEFALSMVRELRPAVPFICPQLHVRQPIAHVKGKGDVRKVRKALPYQFRRGGKDNPGENSWDCLQRLAKEVGWRCFANMGAIYFVSDDDLLKQSARITVDTTNTAILDVSFDLDSGKQNNEATISARASRWQAGPGDVARLDGYGPADGLWIVQQVHRSVYDATAEIQLRRPAKPLPEPAADVVDASSPGGTPALGISGVIGRCWEAAQAIDARHFPYVWGGGHGSAGIPSGGPPVGFDCSGSVVAVLSAGALGFTPGGGTAVSGTLAGWGQPGQGAQMTVYANDVHTFIVFHTKSGDRHFGTGDWGKGWNGAGFNPNLHPTAGFTPRHWPGT